MSVITDISSRSVIDIPADFDPEKCPIIAKHYFGIDPNWRSIGEVASCIVSDIRRRRNVTRLCLEWPRAIDGLIGDIGAKSGRMTDVEQQLEHCVQLLDNGTAEAVGADQLPDVPIHAVQR